MRFLEMPGGKVYHYVKEDAVPRPWCSTLPYTPPFSIVLERSSGRRLCKECFKRARQAKIPLPPRTPWEREQWEKE